MILKRLREGLGWRTLPLRRYAFLVRSFRNGFSLAAQYRNHLPCDKVTLWDGTFLVHPTARGGMLDTILEIWFEQVYTGNFYQPSPGDVIVDGGANVGLFSCWLARQQPKCQILAFEPLIENMEILKQNIKSTRVKNVTTYRAGLGGKSGFGHMEIVGTRSLDHRLTVETNSGPNDIRLYSFSDALGLTSSSRISLFKIDIEGSEYDVFNNASSDDLARVDRLAIEYHEHLRPGVLELINSKLAPTHVVKIVSHRREYGMLYATIKAR